MAKKQTYVLIYGSGSSVVCLNYYNARAAIAAYREAKKIYGDNIRLAKVVVDYGEEV